MQLTSYCLYNPARDLERYALYLVDFLRHIHTYMNPGPIHLVMYTLYDTEGLCNASYAMYMKTHEILFDIAQSPCYSIMNNNLPIKYS